MKIVFITEFFESSALALWLKVIERKDIKVFCRDKSYEKILEGLMEKEKDVFQYLGQGNLFVFDDASSGETADHLRSRGELVMGGNPTSDRMENERAFGQKIMRDCGIHTVPSRNFKGRSAFDEAIQFVKKKPKPYAIKQNGDAAKDLSTIGKFDGGEDVIDALDDFRRSWPSESPVDFDLQEKVFGHEVAVEGWFNGSDFIRDKEGKEVILANWENKKLANGDMGRSTGEMGTLAKKIGVNTPLAKELLKCREYLKSIRYIGNVDINFILDKADKKFYGIEWTMRFGFPMLNLQQCLFRSPWERLLKACASGKDNNFFDVEDQWGVVTCVTIPPFPYSSSKSENNAKGQRVYFLKEGNLYDGELKESQIRNTHLYEVRYDKETKHFQASGDTGYLLTCTAKAETPEKANQKCLEFIKNNVHAKNMLYRTDIGVSKRLKEGIEFLNKNYLI